MATADHIAAALVDLEDQLTAFELLLDVFDTLSTDRTPSWLAVVSDRFLPLSDAVGRMGDMVRRDVLPLHRDFHSLTRSGGGMGAVAPMVTKVSDGQSINSRT